MLEIIAHANLAQALFALQKLGLTQQICSVRAVDPAEISGVNCLLLQRLFEYLAVHGVVERSEGGFTLTRRGRALLSDVSLAQLGFYVEAYGPVTSKISELTSGELNYGSDVVRDGKALGRHCATLFHAFHTDTVLEALRNVQANFIVDLGCGGGQFLVDACLRNEKLRGIGLDLSAPAIEFASDLARQNGLQDRLSFAKADAFDFSTWPEDASHADALTAVGVLHEHFRDGEDAVIALLNKYADFLASRSQVLILGEPEIRMDLQKSDIDLFLVHAFTAQGFPRPREKWIDLFTKTYLTCHRIYTRINAGPRFNFFDLRSN